MELALNAKRITKRNVIFCREYVVDLNVKRAAEAARLSPGTCAQLLRRPEIKFYIAKLQREYFERVELNAERVLMELAAIAFINMQDFVVVGEDGLPRLNLGNLTREQWAAVGEYTEDRTGGQNDGERALVMRHRVKLADKTKALELLGKHFALFTEKHEHTFSDDIIAKLNEGRQRVLEHK